MIQLNKAFYVVTASLTAIISSLLISSPAQSQCVEIGAGLAYNTNTKETLPLINGKCKVVTNVYVDPFVKFGKRETTYGMGLNYRFVNSTSVSPIVGIGIETGNGTRGYGKFGLSVDTSYPVLLDVNFKLPFENRYASEFSLGASYKF